MSATDRDGLTALCRASGPMPLACVWPLADRRLSHSVLCVRSGASVCATDRDGLTALCRASGPMPLACVWPLADRRLSHSVLCVRSGASVSATDRDGLTALCWASASGHLACVRPLAGRCSDVQHADRSGRTPLDLAAAHGDPHVVGGATVCRGCQRRIRNWSELAGGFPKVVNLSAPAKVS